MRRSGLFAMFMMLSATLSACGGDDDATTPDAAIDAVPDAPAALVGLGQKCGTGLPACPSNAMSCLTQPGAQSGFCSAVCVSGATGMTNASGQFTSLTPLPNDALCTAAFTGTVGTAACGVLITLTPMEQPMANKTYTNVSFACGIACGASNACPFGTTCTSGLCQPT